MAEWREKVVRSAPYIAGVLALPALPPPEILPEYLHRFAVFLLLWISVGCVHSLVRRFYGRERAADTAPSGDESGGYRRRPFFAHPREFAEVLGLIVAVVSTLIWLQLFRLANPAPVFHLLLASIFAISLAARMAQGPRFEWATVARYIGYTGIAYLSIQISTGSWLWQPVLLSLALAGPAVATSLASATDVSTPRSAPQRRRIARLTTGLLCSGPMFVVLLIGLHQLPTPFGLTVLPIPLISKHLALLRNYERDGTVPPRHREVVSATALLFIVILVGVGVLFG